MDVQTLAIPEVKLIVPRRFEDARGYFAETFHAARFAEAGIPGPFVQDNHSLSRRPGTIRGLHSQIAPAVQGKLVRCIRGAIFDVAVDLREGSPTFGQHVSAVLSAENGAQLWIPGGFLHGFCTLAPDTEVLYKVTAPYDRAAERGVIWNDPELAIPWPVDPGEAVLSEKDAALPRLTAAKRAEDWPWFRYHEPFP
jgi:dTDP-4-dehydrorhamnose 3,5-epimerase